jgi:enamine deaminase RidA (YjgF/YER057c/UK114 family)
MPRTLSDRIQELKLELPQVLPPQFTYVPYVRTGNLVFISGQVCQWNGERHFIGKLGREFQVEQGQEAARMCALNVLAQLNVAIDGDLDRVVQFVNVRGFVNSTPDFLYHPQVINGASDLFVQVLGDAGRHSRTALGVSALPYDVAVEVDAVVEIR